MNFLDAKKITPKFINCFLGKYDYSIFNKAKGFGSLFL